MKVIYGYAVCWVDHDNEILPSHSDFGFYQEVYGTLKAAEEREKELLETTGGVWEIVQAKVELTRFPERRQ